MASAEGARATGGDGVVWGEGHRHILSMVDYCTKPSLE